MNPGKTGKKGQATLEYLILLSVVIAVVQISVGQYLKPALERMYKRVAEMMEASLTELTEK